MNGRVGFWASMPPVTKHLLIVNVIIWLAMFLFPVEIGDKIIKYAGLHYWRADDFNLAQFFTYMFLHDNQSVFHIFFNMFTMVIFGKILEQVWGSKRFLFYYLITGIGAGLIQELAWEFTIPELTPLITNGMVGKQAFDFALNNPVTNFDTFLNLFVSIGASGAVFGILLAFGMMFPNVPMYLFFIPVPIKAKYMVIGYGLIELFLGVNGFQAGVAHFAHLGGMLFGIVILLIWRKKKMLGGENF